jgi:DNA-binding NtrC family response regulator
MAAKTLSVLEIHQERPGHLPGGAAMRVLIVSDKPKAVEHWRAHLLANGWHVLIVRDQAAAVAALCAEDIQIMLLNLMMKNGSALAIADFASYRQPALRVIFHTDSSVFSDGSIFTHCGNAFGYVRSSIPSSDLAALIEHHGRAA